MIRLVLALVATCGIMTGSASTAATVGFDFSGSGGNTGSNTSVFTESGVSVSVVSTGGNINIGSKGLGVQGNPDSGRMGVGESLTFSFSPMVSLLSAVAFERGNGSDTVAISDASGTVLNTFIVSSVPGSLFTQDLSGFNLTGDTFTFSVIAASGSLPGLRIRSLEVDPELTPVPLPATSLLLFAGIGGLAMFRRHKTSNKKPS